MKDFPLVSIVMCSYNGAKYIDEQMDSLVNQTYQNLEIIVVDDKSTDHTIAKIEEWMKKDSRISLYKNEENLGYNRNFEKAISLAKGAYISLSDQDDIWCENKIEHLLSLFDQEDVVLVHARSVEFVDGKCLYPKVKLLRMFHGNDPKKLFYDNQIGGHRIMFKHKLVDRIIPIPPNMFYDWWIGVVATCNGSINSSESFLVKYRIHDANSHINVPKAVKAAHIDHIEAWKCFLTIEEMKQDDKLFLKNLITVFDEHRKKKKLFDHKLFSFLFKNRKIVFANRRRLVKDFLFLKFLFYYTIVKF
ncbi:glycosyltransferase [Pedobacter chinensis]|nr:glycosyltransferase [Pedobacter chinensis]